MRPFNKLLIFFFLCSGICWGQTTESNCNDGLDNNGDGLTDCADPDCSSLSLCDHAIPCEEEAVFYQILDGNTFVRLDPETESFVEIFQNDYRVNAIGYNTQDGFIYGIRSTPPSMRNHLVKIGIDGVFDDQGPIENLPFSSEYIYLSGDFDSNGRLFINNTQVSNIYEIDINERLLASVYPQSFALSSITDLVYLPDSGNDGGKFYSLSRIGGNLFEFDPATGILQNLGPLSPSVSCDLAFGAGFADSSGFLYFFCNSSGEVLKVDPNNMSSEFILSTSTILELNDGASCPTSSAPFQDVDATEMDEITCTDGLDNDGDGLSDCADPDCAEILACDNAIPCDDESVFYQVLSGSEFVQYVPESGNFSTIFVNNFEINAMGYNTQDGYIYGIRSGPQSFKNHLVRVGIDGVFQDLGPVTGLPNNITGFYNAGDVDENGHLIIGNQLINRQYKINIASQAVVDVFPQTISMNGISEYVYVLDNLPNGGLMYTLERGSFNLFSLNPEMGEFINLGPLSGDTQCSVTFGAGLSDVEGNLYFICNSSGDVFKIDIQSLTISFIESIDISLTENDGASCPYGLFSPTTSIISETSQTICEGDSFQGFTEAGTYSDTTSTEGGDSIWILNLAVQPTYEIEIDTQICLNQTFEGYAESGQYIDTLQSLFGCDSIRTINLEVVDNPIEVIDTVLCAGESFEGYTESGLYIDSIPIPGSCDLIRTIKLTVLESEPFLEDGLFCDSTSVTLTSPSPNTQWSTGEVGSSIEVNTEGIITAFYIDENGCVQVDTVRINLLTATAYLPNVFSPNSDNINDLFQPYFNRNASGEISYEFSIYNRWGGLVAVVTENQKGWNGISQKTNKPCEQGIYLYELRIFSLTCPERRMIGSLTLLR